MNKICIDCKSQITELNQKLGGGSKKDKRYITQRCKLCYAIYRKKYKIDIKCNFCSKSFKIAKQRYTENWNCKNCRQIGLSRVYLNHNYFAIPNLENSYWAGFIAADGCINNKNLQITLSKQDYDLLKKFKQEISYDGNIYNLDYFHSTVQKEVHHCTISITSGIICADLFKNFNITSKKSLTLCPPNLNGDLALAFIKGYIDGDGCISDSNNYIRLQILGTKQMMQWILSKFRLLSNGGSINTKGNIYQLRISGYYAMKILPIINNVVYFGLSRKWSKIKNHNRLYRDADKYKVKGILHENI